MSWETALALLVILALLMDCCTSVGLAASDVC